MEVASEDDKWEESQFRERSWSAMSRTRSHVLKKHPVRPLLDAAAARLERRKRPTVMA